MKKNHEQSTIDSFNKIFQYACNELDKPYSISASLDGQDSILGADYLFNSDTKFILIEFKYEFKDIKSEKSKDLRRCLCKSLESNAQNTDLHTLCHFIAWSEIIPPRECFIGNYAEFVCSPVFDIKIPHMSTYGKESAYSFCKNFISNSKNIGLNFDDFNSYIQWLLSNCSGNSDAKIETIISNPENPIELLDFNNLEDLNNFITKLNQLKNDTSKQSPTKPRKPK